MRQQCAKVVHSESNAATLSASSPNAKVACFHNSLKKTKLCAFFVRGACERGNRCGFAHGRDQLQDAPDLYKTTLCDRYMTKGFCKKGKDCSHAHGLQELRSVAFGKNEDTPCSQVSTRTPSPSDKWPSSEQDSMFFVQDDKDDTWSTIAPIDIREPSIEITIHLHQARLSRFEELASEWKTLMAVRNTFVHIRESSPLRSALRSQSCPACRC